MITENNVEQRLAEIRKKQDPEPGDIGEVDCGLCSCCYDAPWLLELVDILSNNLEQSVGRLVHELTIAQNRVLELEAEPCSDCHYGACWEYCRCEELNSVESRD